MNKKKLSERDCRRISSFSLFQICDESLQQHCYPFSKFYLHSCIVNSAYIDKLNRFTLITCVKSCFLVLIIIQYLWCLVYIYILLSPISGFKVWRKDLKLLKKWILVILFKPGLERRVLAEPLISGIFRTWKTIKSQVYLGPGERYIPGILRTWRIMYPRYIKDLENHVSHVSHNHVSQVLETWRTLYPGYI